MPLPSPRDRSPRTPGRDTLPKAIFLGLIIPLLLIAWGLWNLHTGRVTWPARGGYWPTVTDPFCVTTLALTKLSAALALFAHYFLATRPRLAYYSQPLALLSSAAALLAFLLGALSFLLW